MKKEKKQKAEKKTLYAILIEQFINAGYKVEEGSWKEPVGYYAPTEEYWFDVKIPRGENLMFTMHYWFGPDLNTLTSVEGWSSKIQIVETDEVKLF